MNILFKDVIILDMESKEPVYDRYVAIEDNKILAVGSRDEVSEVITDDGDFKVIEGRGRVLLPGMVNGHTHLFQTFARGFVDGRDLFTWLKNYMWPFSAAMEKEDFYLSSLIGCVENVKNGATGLLDQHYAHCEKQAADETIRGMAEVGVRGTYCRTFGDIMPFKPLQETETEIMEESRRLVDAYHGSENGRIQMALGPLNPWGASKSLLQSSFGLAEEKDLAYQIHTAETDGVVQKTLEMYGMRNVPFFDDLGILNERTQLAHSIWLDDEEVELVAKRGSMVVYNPVANMILGDGVAKVPLMRKLGIKVALGTDGPGSNDRQDMFESLKTGALLQKNTHLDPLVLDRYDMLEMGVQNGRYVLRDEELGEVKPGYKADLILVNLETTHTQPVHDVFSALVYNCMGSDVDTAVIDGEIVMEERKMTKVDEQGLYELCRDRIKYLRNKIGI